MAHMTELFLDDHLIEVSAGVTRRIQPPAKHPANPVSFSDQWWEGNINMPFATIYDKQDKLFKMWTRSGWDGLGAEKRVIDDNHAYSCYLTSSDGVNWEKPQLGAVDFGGRRDHNIVFTGTRNVEFDNMARQGKKGFIQNVAVNPKAKDEKERYVALAYNMGPVRGVYLGYSPDGIHWSFEKEAFWRTPLDWAPWGDDHQTQLIFDHDHDTWVIYRRVIPQENHRMIGRPGDESFPRVDRYVRIWARAESPDFKELHNPQVVLATDADDPEDTEFYNLVCHRYEQVYIAYVGVSHFSTGAYYLDVQLGVSRDGIDFRRVCRREPFIAAGPQGNYRNGWIDYDVMQGWQSEPIVVDDTVYVYYKGFNRQHGHSSSACVSYEGAAIGLATFRRDRFVALEAGAEEGMAGPARLITKPLKIEHPNFYVNASAFAEAAIRVELLRPDWQPIPGFTETECAEIRGDALSHRVRWADKADLGSLVGQDVRVKFCMNRARLHAMTLSTEELEPQHVSDFDGRSSLTGATQGHV